MTAGTELTFTGGEFGAGALLQECSRQLQERSRSFSNSLLREHSRKNWNGFLAAVSSDICVTWILFIYSEWLNVNDDEMMLAAVSAAADRRIHTLFYTQTHVTWLKLLGAVFNLSQKNMSALVAADRLVTDRHGNSQLPSHFSGCCCVGHCVLVVDYWTVIDTNAIILYQIFSLWMLHRLSLPPVSVDA